MDNKKTVVAAGIGVLTGLGIGFGLGALFERRRNEQTLDEEGISEEDDESESAVVTIDEIRAKRRRAAEQEHPSAQPPRILTDILEASKSEDGEKQGFTIPAEEYENIVKNPRRDPSEIVAGIPESAEGVEVVQNIWDDVDNSVPDWDWDAELKHREEISYDTPYILHRNEFFEDETNYGQTTLTYYAGDKKLTDEKDSPLYNQGDIVGDCLRFGHGSGDPHVVYIRNNKLHAEYEVVLHEGSYDVEVLGLDAEEELDAELRHSEHRPLKFRME